VQNIIPNILDIGVLWSIKEFDSSRMEYGYFTWSWKYVRQEAFLGVSNFAVMN
jgi:hypothetical protein